MAKPAVVGVDFETLAIGPRPREYPPRPVGVSIYHRAAKIKTYLAWGHPRGNNCTRLEAVGRLKDIYASEPIVYHNAAFDIEVGEKHLGLKPPREWHDTMLLAYLSDPRQGSLSLKPLADRLLGRPPREQNRLTQWIMANIPEATWKTAGAHISQAPVELVGPYAIGDVTRTVQLFDLLYPEIRRRDMLAAYSRECKLVPVLNKMQARGIRVDVKRLERDIQLWYKKAKALESYVISRLGGKKKLGPDFNLASHSQLADALEDAELVENLPLTAKGNKSVKREVLKTALLDQKLYRALAERAVLLKYISTYGLKWLENNTDGMVYPRINQVHGYHDYSRGGGGGARTGRLSYSDSWQAIPAPDRRLFDTLPNLRDYVVADKGRVLNARDYSQQEFRILAHFEDGSLLKAYQDNPRLDMHEHARICVEQLIYRDVGRRPIKDMGFGLIYGMGLAKLARKMDQTQDMAKDIRAAYMKAIPGLTKLKREIEDRCRRGEPIRTWGGREYFVEPPKMTEDGDVKTFDYKMINVLIQGSAGDCTKEAMIRADKAGLDLLLQIHDELLIESDTAAAKNDMDTLRIAMETVEFDLLMLSDGKRGRRWGSLKKVKD